MGGTTNRCADSGIKVKYFNSGPKKKVLTARFVNRIEAFYNQIHECPDDCHHLVEAEGGIDLTPWVKVMEKIIKDRYEGKLKPEELDEAYIHQTYKELSKGVAKGYGPKFDNILDDEGNPSPEVMMMRQNLFRFSMAKDVAMLTEINQYLSGGDKVMRFEEFRDKVLKLNKRYNLNYLRAEYNTALQAGKHAADWEHYERMKDIYPNLEYRTQQDNKVRDEHAALHGIIAPIDSDFWAVHYPPNGWNCRCFVVQTAATPTNPKNIPQLSDKQLRPEFRINVGITGQVFKETDLNDGKPHPYFALVKDQPELRKAFELAKLTYAPHTIYKGKNGGKVQLNIFADRKDLLSNYRSAKRIVDEFGINVKLNPDIDIDGWKNPELNINKIISDQAVMKTTNLRGFATNTINKKLNKEKGQLKGLEQCSIVLDIGLKKYSRNELEGLAAQLKSKIDEHETIIYVYILNGNKTIRISREDIENESIFIKIVELNK